MKSNILKKLIFILIVFSGLISARAVFASEDYFSDGTLFKGTGPEVFVLENTLKRWITNPKVFNGFEYDWKKILQVPDSVLSQYPGGRQITSSYRFPDGSLVKGSGPKVYLIKKGRRHWIPNSMTFNNLRLCWKNIVQITDKKLKRIYESKSLAVQIRPKKYPETWFLDEPSEFIESDRVTLKFSGQAKDIERSSLKFETFLEGYDKNWRTSRQGQRTVKLEQRDAPYVFFVRASDGNGNIDPTPARYSFYTKISPYFDKIIIRSGKIKQSDPAKEYISLYNRSRETIDLSGWSLNRTYQESTYNIPQVKQFIGRRYDEEEQNIKLPPGGKVLIFSGFSPISWSFRLNKCTGYLNNYCQFYPTLPKKCPALFKDNLYSSNITPACRKLIKRLGSCQEPETEIPYSLERNCRDFILENINYQACLKRHQDEADFLEKTWYVYLAKEKELWNNVSDEIILKDKDGLVVDRYQY